MSVQSFVGGKALTDVIDKVFAGTPLSGLMERVKSHAGLSNGGNGGNSSAGGGEALLLPRS